MPLLAAGHKRTGACPTFERPVLQRDGHLVRVPLVGGALTVAQARSVASVAAAHGSGVIELTNRGNLQLRGVAALEVDEALEALRRVGLGDPDAALVTISPFAGRPQMEQRRALLDALHLVLADGPSLAPKFVVHLDDADGRTAGRRAEAVLAVVGDSWRVAIAGLGQQVVSAEAAIRTVVALADACRRAGDQARVADLIAILGARWLRAELPAAPGGWLPIPATDAADLGPLGSVAGPDGSSTVFAAARAGRTSAAELAELAQLVSEWGAELRVTPWRSFAVVLPAPRVDPTDAVRALARLGWIVDAADPAAGVVSCIGAAGCWQTETDTLAEVERQIRHRATGPRAGERGVLHVTGCDKRCATRSATAVTLLARPDGSGFDEVPPT